VASTGPRASTPNKELVVDALQMAVARRRPEPGLVHRRSWPTRHDLTSEVFEYIEAFYNRVRRHSTLGMLAPLEFENRTLSNHRPSFAASPLRVSQPQ
jgi:transposase InsO family protein